MDFSFIGFLCLDMLMVISNTRVICKVKNFLFIYHTMQSLFTYPASLTLPFQPDAIQEPPRSITTQLSDNIYNPSKYMVQFYAKFSFLQIICSYLTRLYISYSMLKLLTNTFKDNIKLFEPLQMIQTGNSLNLQHISLFIYFSFVSRQF